MSHHLPGATPAPGARWLGTGTPPGSGPLAVTTARTCPFCRTPAAERTCGCCGRDTTAARWPCPSCATMVPRGERACWSCGTVAKSDLRWKIPLIIALFGAAIVLSVAINVAINH